MIDVVGAIPIQSIVQASVFRRQKNLKSGSCSLTPNPRLDGETGIISRFYREGPGSIPGRAADAILCDHVGRQRLSMCLTLTERQCHEHAID